MEQLNRGQSEPVDNKVDSLTVQCNSKVLEKTERPEIENGIQSPVCETIGQQFEFNEKQPIPASNSGSHKVETQLEHGEICEHSGVIHLVGPQVVRNHHSAVTDIVNRTNLQPNLLVDSSVQGKNVTSGSALIRQDLWKQLKREIVPIFKGEKKTHQNWKAAFMACVDQAPATAEYKLLQLKQCHAGEALRALAIEGLGHSAAAYQAAKVRLERKFGG